MVSNVRRDDPQPRMFVAALAVPCSPSAPSLPSLETGRPFIPSSRSHAPVGRSNGLISGHTLHGIPARPPPKLYQQLPLAPFRCYHLRHSPAHPCTRMIRFSPKRTFDLFMIISLSSPPPFPERQPPTA